MVFVRLTKQITNDVKNSKKIKFPNDSFIFKARAYKKISINIIMKLDNLKKLQQCP